MSTPEALRLAEIMGTMRFKDNLDAARELRRQHAEIERLTAERVRDAYMSTNTRTHDQTFAAFRDGVRIAERAHGIGANTGSKP